MSLLERADVVLHVGDFTAASVLAELRELAPVEGVHGNMDDAELRRKLPADRVVEAADVRIGLIHDAGPAKGRLARMRRRFPDADVVVFGHSHIPWNAPGREGQLLFNPGSPTDRRRQLHHTIGVLEMDRGRVLAHDVVVVDP